MRILRLTAVAGLALAAATVAAVPAQAAAAPRHGGAHRLGAVFVQTDNVAGNTVVAYDRHSDGTLTEAHVYRTGGLGGVLTGSVVDHTASQGALLLDRGRLYAVNAGSDTITVFDVHGDRLHRRQVVSSGGTFPVSVTAHGNLVYVLNARDGGSVQGFAWFGGRLVRVADWHRALNLDTTATPEFTHTPGQVAFTPDGRQLIVTTKAGSNAIDVFAVHGSAGPSDHPTITPLPGAVPFALTFDARGHAVVAETGTNSVVSYAVHHDGTLTEIGRVATGGAATCWVTTDGRHFYASNAGSNTVTGVRDTGSGRLTLIGDTPTDAGPVDATVSRDGRNLYVQGGKDGVVDAFRIGAGGVLTALGTVTVPGAAGGEGIAAN